MNAIQEQIDSMACTVSQNKVLPGSADTSCVFNTSILVLINPADLFRRRCVKPRRSSLNRRR